MRYNHSKIHDCMGIFDFLKGPDICKGIEEYRRTAGAVLLDVRTPQEYEEGRIPGSINIPLQTLGSVEERVPERDTPVFVYCYSRGRSKQAAGQLRKMSYTRVEDLGGILYWNGEVES